MGGQDCRTPWCEGLLEPSGTVNFISGLPEKMSQELLCILSKDNETQKQGLGFSAVLPRSFPITQGKTLLGCEGVRSLRGAGAGTSSPLAQRGTLLQLVTFCAIPGTVQTELFRPHFISQRLEHG